MATRKGYVIKHGVSCHYVHRTEGCIKNLLVFFMRCSSERWLVEWAHRLTRSCTEFTDRKTSQWWDATRHATPDNLREGERGREPNSIPSSRQQSSHSIILLLQSQFTNRNIRPSVQYDTSLPVLYRPVTLTSLGYLQENKLFLFFVSSLSVFIPLFFHRCFYIFLFS
jgi:hypothetical protein